MYFLEAIGFYWESAISLQVLSLFHRMSHDLLGGNGYEHSGRKWLHDFLGGSGYEQIGRKFHAPKEP